ncbi:MAG TPA: hypothetical protein VK157_05960 [Phycisphaerales bacterium]|nr:hypothetical protein [Phycisphaerales bacterium]
MIQVLAQAKTRGLKSGLSACDNRDKAATLSASVGEDYNKLLSEVGQAFPEAIRFLPPTAEVRTFESGAKRTVTSAQEMFILVCQLEELLTMLAKSD